MLSTSWLCQERRRYGSDKVRTKLVLKAGSRSRGRIALCNGVTRAGCLLGERYGLRRKCWGEKNCRVDCTLRPKVAPKLITVHRTYFVALVGFPKLENKAVTREFVAFPFSLQSQATINEREYRFEFLPPLLLFQSRPFCFTCKGFGVFFFFLLFSGLSLLPSPAAI